MNNKLVKTLMISFVLVFSMFFIKTIDVEAKTTQGEAFCIYYFTKDQDSLYYEKTTYTGVSHSTKIEKGTWDEDVKVTIRVLTNFTDGKVSSGLNYTAKCEMGNKESDTFQEGNCDLPNETHVDKTQFVTQNQTDMLCPNLYLNGVFQRNGHTGRYDLDFTANKDYSPEHTPTGNIKVVGHRGWASNDTSDQEDKEKLEKYKDEDSGENTTEGRDKEEIDCTLLDGQNGEGILKELSTIFTVMQVAGIIILVLLSIWDFTQAITSADDDRLKKSGKRFMHRIIAAVILLLLPVIIKFILDVLEKSGVDSIGGFCIDQFL